MLTKADIETRKPVWSALSELWLDNERQADDLAHIAQVMYNSGYSLAELRKIYETEVAPVVYTNLLVPAGEWAGFDDAWLHECIITSLNKKRMLDSLRFKLKRRAMFYVTKTYWLDLESRVQSLKQSEEQQEQ